MPPVTYVLAMFVTYVLATDPPKRPKMLLGLLVMRNSRYRSVEKRAEPSTPDVPPRT